MLSRTLYLAIRLRGDIDHRPISPSLLAGCDTKILDVTNDTGAKVLSKLIEWICEKDFKPESVCVGTYGAFTEVDGGGNRNISAISKNTSGPLVPSDLRKVLASEFKQREVDPLISIETDVGVYAIGENYIRGLPDSDNTEVLSRDDALAFGFFTGGVGAAVSRNLEIIRGKYVGQRGKSPVYPHLIDVEIGFVPDHPFPFSLEAHTDIAAIEKRAAMLDGRQASFDELTDNPDHQVWDIVAHYGAMFCFSTLVNFSPKIIVLGGRTMTKMDSMVDLVRSSFASFISDAGEEFTSQMPSPNEVMEFIQCSHSLETSLYGCLQIAKVELQKMEANSD